MYVAEMWGLYLHKTNDQSYTNNFKKSNTDK